ncbi:ANTAR domain-containing protein [Arsenicicoccus dermatophilus]|uniref:ANTAR domain-containing protein n=1 Tax=Arsenicicoccus dermatophilus TaxID=1076331 RepID=UPI003916E9FC
MTTVKAEPAAVFAELTTLIHGQPAPAAVYQAIVTAAVSLVAGCDHAALMLVDAKGRFYTAAATDDIAIAVDDLELALAEGPCVDAILDEAYQHDPDLSDGTPWPELAARVLAETPVRGMIGYRLLLDEQKVGSLDLFSDTPHAMDRAAADQGAVLASFASVAVMGVRAQDTSTHLERALGTSREIGKAIGLLMAAHRVDDERAFEILRKTSQDLNIRLATLAEEIVTGQRVQYVAHKTPRTGSSPESGG